MTPQYTPPPPAPAESSSQREAPVPKAQPRQPRRSGALAQQSARTISEPTPRWDPLLSHRSAAPNRLQAAAEPGTQPYSEEEARSDPRKLVANAEYYFDVRHDMKLAERTLRRALVKNPRELHALCTMAKLLRRGRRDTKGAIRTLNSALKVDPEFVPALAMLADIAHHDNDAQAAEGYYKRALALEPHNADLLVALSSLHLYAVLCTLIVTLSA